MFNQVTMTSFTEAEFVSIIDSAVQKALANIIEPSVKVSEDQILTKIQLKKLLGISYKTIHNNMRKGKLPYMKMGQRIYFIPVRYSRDNKS